MAMHGKDTTGQGSGRRKVRRSQSQEDIGLKPQPGDYIHIAYPLLGGLR